MKKIFITIAAMTVLSVSGAKAWQVDVNVGDVNVSAGDGYVDVYTPYGYGGGNWVSGGSYHPVTRRAGKKMHRSIKRSSTKIRRIKHRRLRRR